MILVGVSELASTSLSGLSPDPEPDPLEQPASDATTTNAVAAASTAIDFFIEIPFSVMDGLVSTRSRLLSQEFVEVFLTDDGGVPRVAVV
jgi:hypothetical protein